MVGAGEAREEGRWRAGTSRVAKRESQSFGIGSLPLHSMPLSGLSASQRIHIVHPPTRIPNMRCAVLDDYQSKAHNYADWASLERLGVTTTFFTDILGRNPLPDAAIPELVERLKEFDVVVCMRERTPMPRLVGWKASWRADLGVDRRRLPCSHDCSLFIVQLLEQLPNLKLLFTTGMGNASFDIVGTLALSPNSAPKLTRGFSSRFAPFSPLQLPLESSSAEPLCSEPQPPNSHGPSSWPSSAKSHRKTMPSNSRMDGNQRSVSKFGGRRLGLLDWGDWERRLLELGWRLG